MTRRSFRLVLCALCVMVACLMTGTHASPPAAPQAGDVRVRAADGMEMTYVPAGEFVMGTTEDGVRYAQALCREACGASAIAVCRAAAFADERPEHSVTVDGFWIDRTEVTNAQYRRCVAAGACSPPQERDSFTRAGYADDPAYDNYPVVWVTWQQAADYAAWAGARLPTEAEWEYAARGTESRTFPWGEAFDGTRLNYCDALCALGPKDPATSDGYADTAPVGSFPLGASWCGVLDLAGNVREWVADWFGMYSSAPQRNPAGPASGEAHIAKGGSWLDRADDVRAANRGANALDYAEHKVGFRCAADAAP